MIIDWLVVWGVTQAVGFAFKPIFEELAKDATKDWIKDMFKGCLSSVIKIPQEEPLEIAAGKAIKEFLELFQQELEFADLDDEAIRTYIKPLSQCVVNDPFQRQSIWQTNPRQTALKYLVELFPNHPQLPALLQDRLNNDSDEQVSEYVQSVINQQ